MSMININLYDYKRVIREVTIQKHVTLACSLVLLAIVACGLEWMMENSRIGTLEGEIAEVESQVAQLTPEYNQVQGLRKRHGKLNSIIAGIDELRSKQGRTTEILEDIGRSLPENVWLEKIEQKNLNEIKNAKIPFLFIEEQDPKKRNPQPDPNAKPVEDRFFEVKGVGKSDQAVIYFLEQLKNISYFDHVLLFTSTQKWIDTVPVRKFTIYCHVMNPGNSA